jgi:Mor family transcriptional regulator
VEGTNLRAFAREKGLDSANLAKVLVGKQTHHKGWRKEDIPWTPRQSVCQYVLIDSNGTLFTGENSKDLCKQFNLSHSSIWAVNKGIQAEHNGWKRELSQDF